MIGYVFGSIPFGYIVGKLHGIDLRKVGSGSTGGTNVYRSLGLVWALVSGLLDFAKGAVFLIVVQSFVTLSRTDLFFLGLTPIIGHIYPVWLRFKGGKGVSVSFGILAYLLGAPISVIVGLIWVIAVKTIRIMSLINIILFLFVPLYIFIVSQSIPQTFAGCMITAIIWWAHRENIRRLWIGKESKLTI